MKIKRETKGDRECLWRSFINREVEDNRKSYELGCHMDEKYTMSSSFRLRKRQRIYEGKERLSRGIVRFIKNIISRWVRDRRR